MLLEQINSVHISADWSSRVWELPAFLIEWVVVWSAKFCYGLLALLAIAYLPRANLPTPPQPAHTKSQQHLRALRNMAGAGSNGEALASRMEDRLRFGRWSRMLSMVRGRS